MSFSVTFSYRNANSGFEREGKLNISTPGTKVTPKLALYVAQQSLGRFIENDPVDDLISAKCTVSGTSQHVFNIVLFTEETDTQCEQSVVSTSYMGSKIGREPCRERECQYV